LNALDAVDEASSAFLSFPTVSHELDVRDQILQWSAPNTSQQRQCDLSLDRVPGTRKWLLAREDYQRWRNGLRRPNNTIWCHGEAGSGKSMLTWVAFALPGENYLPD